MRWVERRRIHLVAATVVHHLDGGGVAVAGTAHVVAEICTISGGTQLINDKQRENGAQNVLKYLNSGTFQKLQYARAATSGGSTYSTARCHVYFKLRNFHFSLTFQIFHYYWNGDYD